MSPHEQAEHTKLCHELDELRGDLIEARNDNESLKKTICRQYGTIGEMHKKLLANDAPPSSFWTYFWFSLLGSIITISILYIYSLQRELTFWKCQPSYQSPSSPVEN